jgi:hypothetical protein
MAADALQVKHHVRQLFDTPCLTATVYADLVVLAE